MTHEDGTFAPLMSDALKHECGLAYLRLLKPLSHYHRKYGTAFYGLNKLYLLMEKQHNRGQDGAGIATLKLNVEPGHQFMHRLRVSGSGAIAQIFATIQEEMAELEKNYPDIRNHPGLLKGYLRFMGETLLGHLRYGTQGRNNVEFCHPFFKPHINPARTLTMAGNFNLVNTDAIFAALDAHPTTTVRESDLGAMIECVHYYLGLADDTDPSELNVEGVLQQAARHFDGGYVCSGLIGNGDSFVLRDPNGIRPAFFYHDDEIVVAASERPALMTAFNLSLDAVQELRPGSALFVKGDGTVSNPQILPERERAACSFERIYFSRGSDADIYKERKQLGRNLAPAVLKKVGHNLKDTIVSYIPNTAETAFYGLIKGMEAWLNEVKLQRIRERQGEMNDADLLDLIGRRVRIEKIAIKDVKLRTFITEDAARSEMVQHVYDITYGTVRPGIDTLVVIDDSIVRGTTLRESIIRMLDRLGPKKIIIVSSSPQIRYPDCYGIDMSRMGDFIAFQAAVELLKDRGQTGILDAVYDRCKAAQASGEQAQENFVKGVYAPFSYEAISEKIAAMLRADEVSAEVDVIYQTLDGLHEACPDNRGAWYFSGDYPTPGGHRVANRAFMNWMEGAKDGGISAVRGGAFGLMPGGCNGHFSSACPEPVLVPGWFFALYEKKGIDTVNESCDRRDGFEKLHAVPSELLQSRVRSVPEKREHAETYPCGCAVANTWHRGRRTAEQVTYAHHSASAHTGMHQFNSKRLLRDHRLVLGSAGFRETASHSVTARKSREFAAPILAGRYSFRHLVACTDTLRRRFREKRTVPLYTVVIDWRPRRAAPPCRIV